MNPNLLDCFLNLLSWKTSSPKNGIKNEAFLLNEAKSLILSRNYCLKRKKTAKPKSSKEWSIVTFCHSNFQQKFSDLNHNVIDEKFKSICYANWEAGMFAGLSFRMQKFYCGWEV